MSNFISPSSSNNNASGPQHVILIHGLWMPAKGLNRLASRLKIAGYSTSIFGYRSVRDSFADHIPACVAHIEGILADIRPSQLHFVGHSMGGLVTLKALQWCQQQGTPLLPGKQVLLGSPINGSCIAQHRQRLGGLLIGRSQDTLAEPNIQLPRQRATGMIAGTLSRGSGRILAKLDKPNDGTVALAETQMTLLSDHLALAVSHTGMLLNDGVAGQVAYFLKHGYFQQFITPS